MIRTQIYLPEELLLEAKLFSKKTGVNLSEFIRLSIKNYTAQISKDKTSGKSRFSKIRTIKPSQSIMKDVDPDQISNEIDKIVYDI